MNTVAAAPAQRVSLAQTVVVAGVLALYALAGISGHFAFWAPILTCTIVLIAWHEWLLSWRVLLAGLTLVILFVPIRRYTMGGGLPFQIEPYRLFVAFLIFGWLASLLIDTHVRLRRTGLEGPIILVIAAALVSDVFNPGRIKALDVQADVVKSLTFFISFFIIFYIIASTVRRSATIDFVIKVLVGGAAFLAIFALIESRTRSNAFNHLDKFVPFLNQHTELFAAATIRGARLRAYASAEHPIALGAAFALLVPLGLYLSATASRRWFIATLLIAAGALSSVSRTAVVMLLVIGIVFFVLRPKQTKRFWPALIPLVVVVHFAIPGTLGTLKQSFFPREGLIEEQRGYDQKSGRIADIGPTLRDWSETPLYGQGFGTRIPSGPRTNARILDNQWLATLVETGLLGIVGLFWLFWRIVRRLSREAKTEETARGWLLVSLAASITAFAVGMFTYDAFSFIQVTFLLFILLGLATVVASPEYARRVAPSLRRTRLARASAESFSHT